jgi:hypothetical protein
MLGRGGPGVYGLSGGGEVEVAVQHCGQCGWPVEPPFGGGERCALPGGTGLAGGYPAGDYVEQAVGFRWRHVGVQQTGPGRRQELGHELGRWDGARAAFAVRPGERGR